MVGSCLCGEVEFQLKDQPLKLYQCHCSLCRKQSGAAANAATLVGKDSFVWQKGQMLIRSYVKSSGFRSDFCAKCGSPVPNIVGKGDYMWIPAGLLENSGNLEIVAHLFLGSKAAWEPRPQKGELFETGPGLEQVYQLLHKM